MPPKKKMKGNVGFVEKTKYEEETKAMKIVIEEKNVEIQALKVEVKNLKSRASETKEKVDKLERKLNIIDKLKDKIECPVCMEIPRASPVPVCPNGHLVCQECTRDTCPTCRVRMGTGKSLLASTIIENIEHKCKFSDCGEFFPLETIEEHIKVCPHRTVSCPYGNCGAKIVLSKILNHLNEGECSTDSAPVRIGEYPDVQKVTFKVEEVMKSAPYFFSSLSTYSFEDVDFCIFSEKFGGMYSFYCMMFSSENESSKYKIYMTVHEYGALEDSEVCHRFEGRPFSIDGVKEGFMILSEKAVEKILRKSGENAICLSSTIRKTS